MSRDRDVDALVERAVATTNSMLEGDVRAYDGAKQLWSIRAVLESLEEDLRVFVALADDWQDGPREERDAVERNIIAAADRFRAKWGP